MKKGLRRQDLVALPHAVHIPTADLMKKGLRPVMGAAVGNGLNSNRRPDEEGIKTPATGPNPRAERIPTADLMKKGLRRLHPLQLSDQDIPTADLMKKGLRRGPVCGRRARCIFQPQT